MITLDLYNEGSQKSESRRTKCSFKVLPQGKAILRRSSADNSLLPFLQTPKKCMRVEILYFSRGNLTQLKDMGIVTLGCKAKDTQSLGTSFHNFSPIICGLQASRVLTPDFTNSFLKRRKL